MPGMLPWHSSTPLILTDLDFQLQSVPCIVWNEFCLMLSTPSHSLFISSVVRGPLNRFSRLTGALFRNRAIHAPTLGARHKSCISVLVCAPWCMGFTSSLQLSTLVVKEPIITSIVLVLVSTGCFRKTLVMSLPSRRSFRSQCLTRPVFINKIHRLRLL